ncbi:zinc ribbon domain-containing protein [Pulveribacter suum]|uniref:DUF1887 domain-containing protein n=1 Tax=Pulveribacter suum TaxID=2116657 RepID=A0A2P1NMN5_9BURK|nr:zinc ribbon domain-containing protein [Pulveribacter suum]AVP58305.1 hypothetical protein C7H73_11945 [Pulveribacter suum]
MPIYRCNQCGFVSEDAQTPVNAQTACGRCGTPSRVYGTVFFVEELVKRLAAATRELHALRPAAPGPAPQAPEVQPATAAAPAARQALANVPGLATAEQHAPLKAWFAARQIEVQLDPAHVDTSGFFDDAALLLGSNQALFAELIERVRFAYRKSHSWINLELATLAQKDAQAINQLCRRLYEHTFFARYHYQKPEKIVRLTLQPATAIRQFFEGGWLEWYALMTLLGQASGHAGGVSCARSAKVVFPNEDLHELDVIALPAGQEPICIECKSGEFRRDIDKYLRLKKRLGLERGRFVICSAELTDEQAAGLSAMYELSFVNLQTLGPHVQKLMSS